MSGRAVYLERAERGLAILAARLVSERGEEVLRPADLHAGSLTPVAIAEWLVPKLPKGRGGAPTLDVLCLDTDGGVCSWLSTPSADRAVVAALARQGAAWNSAGDDTPAASDALSVYAAMPQEAAVQPLAPAQPRARAATAWFKRKPDPGAETAVARRRIGVLALADVPARLLMDELDARDVRVESVCSAWHAVAAAWDPGGTVFAHATGRPDRAGADRVVADAPVVLGSVVVDTAGRLIWAWADRGTLIAGGTIRLRSTPASNAGGPSTPAARVTPADVARLASDWLAWSVQLGIAPSRITCVVPESLPDEPKALDAGGFGAALSAAWPGATIDLATSPDPLGATLARLAAAATAAQDSGTLDQAFSPSDPRRSVVELTHRPGKAHFRMYAWAALATTALAAGLGVWAWRLQQSASSATAAWRKAQTQWRELFTSLNVPGPVLPGRELLTLNEQIAKLEQAAKPFQASDPEMPILEELQTLSLVLASENIELTRLVLDSGLTKPTITVEVPGIEVGEQLGAALRQIDGSHLQNWNQPTWNSQPSGKIRATYTASWEPLAKPASAKPGGAP